MERQTTPCFTAPGVWSGGNYELVLFLGAPSESNISESLRIVWSSSCLRGPYLSRDSEPWEQEQMKSDLASVDRLFGVAKIAPKIDFPCCTYIVREENDSGERVGDFLGLYIPLCAIGAVYPIGAYPFGDHEAAVLWRATIDKWFLELVHNLTGALKFEIGVIGWEPQLTLDLVGVTKAAATMEHRFDGVILRTEAGLQWYPPTRYDIIKLK